VDPVTGLLLIVLGVALFVVAIWLDVHYGRRP
jgi:hypothetical protein